MNGELIAALVAGVVIGWFAKWGWDILVDWWLDASGGWLKDIFALVGVVTVCVFGWKFFT